jgi:hypothetical protein
MKMPGGAMDLPGGAMKMPDEYPSAGPLGVSR